MAPAAPYRRDNRKDGLASRFTRGRRWILKKSGCSAAMKAVTGTMRAKRARCSAASWADRRKRFWMSAPGRGFFRRCCFAGRRPGAQSASIPDMPKMIGDRVRQADSVQTCPCGRGCRVILLMDVLEHVDDDVGLLRAYAEPARPGTRFIVSVPAFSWLWSAHDEFLEHRRRYTPQPDLCVCCPRQGCLP